MFLPPAHAWNSLQVLNHQFPLGWFLRAMHGWGSNFMVAVVLIHMAQVFLFGAYKFPRELTWILGVFLLLMTLGMAFTGQVLRFDQDAYWGLGIGASIMGRVPFIGGAARASHARRPDHRRRHADALLRAARLCHSRHCCWRSPALHVWMVLKLGINEWPMPGRIVRRETYIQEYNELAHKDGIPFVPGRRVERPVLLRGDHVCGGGVRRCVRALSGRRACPIRPSSRPCPSRTSSFSGSTRCSSFLPPSMETPFILIAPVDCDRIACWLCRSSPAWREELVSPARWRCSP